MSITLTVTDNRLVLDFHRASGSLEFELQASQQPVVNSFQPGVPPHIKGNAILCDGWLFSTDQNGLCFPVIPIGSCGSRDETVQVIHSNDENSEMSMNS